MRYFVLSFVLFILSGCAAKPLTPDQYYRISVDRVEDADQGTNVVLRRIETPGILGGRALLVGEQFEPLVVREVRGHLWVSPPSQWVSELLLARGLTHARLNSEGSPVRSKYTLDLALTDLFVDLKQSAVRVGLTGLIVADGRESALSCFSEQALEASGDVEIASVAAFKLGFEDCFAQLDQQISGLL